MSRLGQAFNELIRKIKNPNLEEGANLLIEQYQENLDRRVDVDGRPSVIAQAIARRSNVLFEISASFLIQIGKQKVDINNFHPRSGLLNSRYKYAGFDKKKTYVALFLKGIYGRTT